MPSILRHPCVSRSLTTNPALSVTLLKASYTVEPPQTATSTRATILADSPYIDSCLNLSTKTTFFCPQGGLCGEVQLYFFSFIGLLYLGYSVFTLHGMYKEKENAAHCSTVNTRHHDKVWMKTK